MTDDKKLEKLKEAAAGGDVAAMQNLALLAELGGAGNADYTEAKTWWMKAAKKGDGFAMACLADIAEKGLAGTADAEEAKKWSAEAKAHGVADLSKRLEKVNSDRTSKSLEDIIGKKILIVDDSNTVRVVLGKQLSKLGYAVVFAEDGLDGFNKTLADPSIGVIITDVSMPNMGGLEMAKKLRALPDTKDIPIIVLSAERNAAVIQQGKTLNLNGWILKPPKPGALETVLERFMKKGA